MPEELPTFLYHPDPLATVAESEATCVCCGKAQGFIYTGPIYAEADLAAICPWCITDGSAHSKFDACFTDEAGIGDYGAWDAVSENVIKTVAHRTPGFSGWQQERWWTHCGDAGQFIGFAGREELESYGPQAIAAIREDAGLSEGPQWDRFLSTLDKNKGPTAYLFRCRKCGRLGGYQDCH